MLEFHEIPPDAKGYSGRTSLDLGNGKALVVMAVGEEARRVLREAAKQAKKEV